MKTVREVLLERHRNVEPNLDLVRQKALRELEGATGFAELADKPRCASVGEMLRTGMFALRGMRWHLVGLGAAWLGIALLNIDHTPAASRSVAQEKLPPPRQLMTALRENRRQLMEMSATPPTESPAAPPRRSEYQTRIEMV